MLNEFASPLYEGKKKKQNDLCISGYIALVSSKCLPPSKHVSRFARYGSWTDLRRPTFGKDWSRVSGASATEKKRRLLCSTHQSNFLLVDHQTVAAIR